MKTDTLSFKPTINFIQENLPSVDEQFSLLKEQLESFIKCRSLNISINWIDNYYPSSARDFQQVALRHHLKGFEEPYTERHLNWDIETVVHGLAEGILLNCEERNQTKVNILNPTDEFGRECLTCFIVKGEKELSLMGAVKVYFEDGEPIIGMQNND